jgi:bacterioferritin-associated ferredoxin
MKTKISANDLSLSIHEIYKKYNMKAYYKDYCDMMSKYASPEIAEKIQQAFSDGNNVLALHNSVVDFINNAEMTEKQTEQFVIDANDLQTKYPFQSYCKECLKLRKSFLQDRLDYFYNKIQAIKIVRDTETQDTANHIYAFQDSLLAKWLDNSIRKISPKGIQVKYEDLTGKINTIYAIHKEPSFDTEFTEAQLIDRYSGICIFDAFLLHSLYDSITHRWVYVPITLVIDMKSEYITELLEEMQNKDDDDSDEIDPENDEYTL